MPLRKSNLDKLRSTTFDVLIVGGGINGAVSAAALAGKGVPTALIDRGDFAGFTSMNSSNLAWGGIKYMEDYDFKLVRKLCLSRNQLMRSYPSTVQEMRFLSTVGKDFRFRPWYLYLGAWLYWVIGNGFTRVPRFMSASNIETVEPIVNTDQSIGGFEYSDAYLHDNDARFVWNFVRTALDRGAICANYVESLGSRREGDSWVTRVQVKEDDGGTSQFDVRSRVLINAGGPFVDSLNRLAGQKTAYEHVLSKGIHIIVDRLSASRRVLAFFADDGRLFFAIPMGARTCIGTTDTRVDSPYAHVTGADIDFVFSNINKRLRLDHPLSREDAIAYRCGVRPLALKRSSENHRDFLHLSRQHVIEANIADCHLSIFGGKLTDCINVGSEVCERITSMGVVIPHPDYTWFGEPPDAVRSEYLHQVKLNRLDDYTAPDASEPLSARFWRRYGMEALDLVERIREDPSQAEILIKGTEYTRVEVDQAARREMIFKLEDFLRRRSKIALVVRKDEIRQAPGLLEACRLMFGDRADEKLAEYFVEREQEEQHIGLSATEAG